MHGCLLQAAGVLELFFEFHVRTFTRNMTRMRVMFNQGIAYEALLRQNQLP